MLTHLACELSKKKRKGNWVLDSTLTLPSSLFFNALNCELPNVKKKLAKNGSGGLRLARRG